MQNSIDGKKRQGELDPQYKQSSLNSISGNSISGNSISDNSTSGNSIDTFKNGQEAVYKDKAALNFKVMAVTALIAFFMGMLVLLIIQNVNEHRNRETVGKQGNPQPGSTAVEGKNESGTAKTDETAYDKNEIENVKEGETSNYKNDTFTSKADEIADEEDSESPVFFELPGGSTITVPMEAQQVAQLSYEPWEISTDGSGTVYMSAFSVGDRPDPVFFIQEGEGSAPEGGLELPGDALLIPCYKTYEEDERVAFDTGGDKSTEDDDYNDYNIFDSCWFNFCRNAENIIFRAEDGREISLGQVMYSAEHRYSRYAENPLVYFNDDYNFKLTFPQSIAYVFSPSEDRPGNYQYWWWDYKDSTGGLYQLNIGSSGYGHHFGIINIRFGLAGTDGDDSWAPSPVYENDNCYLKIMIDTMEYLEDSCDESELEIFKEYEVILNEAVITFPDGSTHMLGEYAR